MRREGARFGSMLAWPLFEVRDGDWLEYRGVECEKGWRLGHGWKQNAEDVVLT